MGPTPIEHLNLIGDTAESIAKCFELLINAGSTGVWAQADGAVLTITSRLMGSAGNAIANRASTNSDVVHGDGERRDARGRGRRGLADGHGGTPRSQSGGAGLDRGVLSGAEGLRHST